MGLCCLSAGHSTIIPTSAIAAANEEAKTIGITGENKKERGPYVKFSIEAKLAIARYAAENGITASLCHYASRYPDLKESSIRMWRNFYQTELSWKQQRCTRIATNEDRPPAFVRRKAG